MLANTNNLLFIGLSILNSKYSYLKYLILSITNQKKP